jgi:FlaA1/EpsC-like NDP-sugar epimerase
VSTMPSLHDIPLEPVPAPSAVAEARMRGPLRRWGRVLAHLRAPIQAGADALAWFVGLIGAQFIRFDFSLTDTGPYSLSTLALVALAAAGLQVLAGLLFGLYRNRWRYGSIDELGRVVESVLAVTMVLAIARFSFDSDWLPRSTPVIGAAAALVVMLAIRYGWRLIVDFSMRPTPGTSRRVLIVGAGEGGEQVLTSMLRNPTSPYFPVGIIDDDPDKARLSVRGVRVLGTIDELAVVAEECGVRTVVVAIPSAGPELLRRVADATSGAEISLASVPSINQLIDDPLSLDVIRPLTEADLLGRQPADIDLDAVAGYLAGRRVLVTGAGGSIGSELCRQIHAIGPAELIMVDRDESALHAVQLGLTGRALLDDDSLVVADIRDRQRMTELFAERRPHVVFHAAALKHVTLLERFPDEALKTNVVGTQNVLDAALASGVERFVNVSTDKAADPASVLGFTKRIAERLCAGAADGDATVLSVRFGNVLGSRGSVLTAFRTQIEAGGPLTVTDPDVTRYFMTTEEAVQLMVQAGAFDAAGETFVLDMGTPVRIDDVARRLIAQAEAADPELDIEITYTGLRPGEKRHEVLFARCERPVASPHPLISRVQTAGLTFGAVADATLGTQGDALRSSLQRLATVVPDSDAATLDADITS